MEPWLRRTFLKHLREQCRFFALALHDIGEGDHQRVDGQFWGEDRLWYGVQNAILAVANSSKILWGLQAKDGTWPKESERKPLRDFLQVQEPSVLKSKEMRNHMEHFDERIDKWFASGDELSDLPPMVDRTVATVHPGWTGPGRFRWIATNPLIVYFGDDEFDLEAVSTEVARIARILEQELSSP